MGEVYIHTHVFDKDETQVKSYSQGIVETGTVPVGSTNYWTWMDNTPIVHWDKTTAEFWFQRYIAKWLAPDPVAEVAGAVAAAAVRLSNQTPGSPAEKEAEAELEATKKRVAEEAENPLSRDERFRSDRKSKDNDKKFKDLTNFRNRFRSLFNNLRLDKSTGKWMRDLTGLRLTKMIRGRKEFRDRQVGVKNTNDTDDSTAPVNRRQPSGGGPINSGGQKDHSGIAVGVTNFEKEDKYEGQWDHYRPEDMPTEVPLDFVRPIFNERFAHWKHELVLGEYEKRSMQEADKWLQQTPWAIGKIYLQPSIFAHMQEAHIAISRKYKKFAHLRLEDWLGSDEHSYFFSKLVALCIKTSDVLSGKKYGLDKMYMRINLEKRRIMYTIGKLDVPTRGRNRGTSTLPPSVADRRLWRDYMDARKRGDTNGAARAQSDMQRVPF